MDLIYKKFHLNDEDTPGIWAQQANQKAKNLIDTVVGDAITDGKDVTGHKHNKLYSPSGVVGAEVDTGGNLKIKGVIITSIVIKTVDYVITINDNTILADATSNDVTIYLHPDPENGWSFNVACINATFVCKVSGNGNNIDGSASDKILALNQSFTFQYNSVYGWKII